MKSDWTACPPRQRPDLHKHMLPPDSGPKLSAPRFVPVHDRGRVLADTAVCIADGGRVLSDLATLRDQGQLYRPVTSDPTLRRALDEIGEIQRRRIARARAKTREHVWSLIAKRYGAIPPSRVTDRDLGETIVIRMDATVSGRLGSGGWQATGCHRRTARAGCAPVLS
jgi:hypothetical protein